MLETGEYERVGSSQTRQTTIRFVAATNADINSLVESGEFRRDLFYRLDEDASLKVDLAALRAARKGATQAESEAIEAAHAGEEKSEEKSE